jgi:hypothetical protein
MTKKPMAFFHGNVEDILDGRDESELEDTTYDFECEHGRDPISRHELAEWYLKHMEEWDAMAAERDFRDIKSKR